jgi:AhpD family alkylhydroperoxidase
MIGRILFHSGGRLGARSPDLRRTSFHLSVRYPLTVADFERAGLHPRALETLDVVENARERKERANMPEFMYPATSQDLARQRREFAPNIHAAFHTFSELVFADGALPAKTKQLIAVAAAHITQCPYCIKGHTKAALKHGATPQEIMEAIWVAAEMRAGGAYAHSVISIATMNEEQQRHEP